MLWDETGLLVEHLNRQHATLGVVIQGATATTGMSAGREAQSAFKKLLTSLNGEDEGEE